MNYKKFSKTYSYSRTFRYWRIADNKLSSHRCVGEDTPFLTTVICKNCKIDTSSVPCVGGRLESLETKDYTDANHEKRVKIAPKMRAK